MPDWSKLVGRFIVLDGGEGCGKSTQARRLVDFLQEEQGLPVTFVRDPGATGIGEQLRNLLLDPANDAMAMRCEMLCYMAARAQMVAEIIKPALERGDVVLCDRFVSSTLAYQLGGDGLTRDEIMAVGQVAVAGTWPDLTVVLDMPVEASQQRVRPKYVAMPGDTADQPAPSKDRIEQRPLEYHERVRQNFLEQAKVVPEQFAVIDASAAPERVFRALLETLERLV